MTAQDELKKKIIQNALLHVPLEGWTQKVLERAAKEANLDESYVRRFFPKGPIEAISFWSHLIDQEMLNSLAPAPDLRVREKVAFAVRTRLTLLIPYRETARQTSRFLNQPRYLPKMLQMLYTIVNNIWSFAGDTSTDYNFYTKRALLAWVYSSTYIYWLRDDSENFINTWDFLNHRIEEVLTFPTLPKKILSYICPWKQSG